MQGALLRAVFNRVVEEVENNVGEVHLVDGHDGVEGVEIGSDGAAVALHLELEGVDDVEYHCVGVYVFEAQGRLLPVEHRQLKHLLNLKAQAFGLVGYHRAYLLKHGRRLAHALIVEHLCRKRYRRYRCFELVRHVVDEVILHLGEFLLSERHYDGVDEYHKQNEGEGEGRHQEGYRREDVVGGGGKVDFQIVVRAVDIVGEERLHEHVVAVVGGGAVSGRPVEDGAGVVHHRKLERYLDAERVELLPKV